ncbi:MAG: YigZ family protein [Corynebacterium sp.]|nr:YigZ family protein [Corynebacterium sp.]
MNQDYRRPSPDLIETELEIKRSRFITYLTRVENEEEAREFINGIKKQYPDARHHCSAYIYHVENSNPVERSSDDGEPSGTAGMPMLEVLKGSGLLDIAAVVVRYFGGIKLGTGGLVRAYSDATNQALSQVTPMLRAQRELYLVELEHAEAGRIEAELRNRGFTITDIDYGAKVTLTIATEPGADLDSTLAALTSGQAEAIPAGTQWVERSC